MKKHRKLLIGLIALILAYIVLPLLIFDFSEPAVPYDEENYSGRSVAIGPRPRGWVPFAARSIDIPGGADYSPKGWTFRIWKPVCLIYCRANGYALPAEWR